MDTKVTTVIVNATKQGLTMKVGNRNCYARLTSVKVGGEYTMKIDVNWTYQEFLLQDKAHSENQLFINSDDCCDYEHITIKENTDGTFDVQRDLREQFRTGSSAIQGNNNTPHGPNEDKLVKASGLKTWLHKFM